MASQSSNLLTVKKPIRSTLMLSELLETEALNYWYKLSRLLLKGGDSRYITIKRLQN